MTVYEVLKKRNMTIYRLAKVSSVPYATLNDICNGRTSLEKCSAETVYKIAQALNLPMEDLLLPYLRKRSSFENFKSTICHRVKEMGDIPFIIDTLEKQDIRTYYERKWYRESFYLLAMLDYISRENDVPLCADYEDIRRCKLKEPLYPAGIRAIAAASEDDTVMMDAARTAIPEFMRFNIIENEVRNVV